MQLNIKLENFEGPFDLLLHLIKKNKMDIYNIKIHEITGQYLEYIKAMEEMDLEVTSEFILIAATLIEIKSKLLLPKQKDETAEGNEGNPEEELINKLAKYKKFKLASGWLMERLEDTGAFYSKKPEIIEPVHKEPNPEDFLAKVSMLDLYNIYCSVIENYNGKQNKTNAIVREIPIDKFKIENKMEYIIQSLKNKKQQTFSSFIKECSYKIEAIVVFLALLELIKLKRVKAYQDGSFMDIYIQEAESDEEN
ncbi:MAG: segregation/condensation protein A [Solirubrobacterales bacterium]